MKTTRESDSISTSLSEGPPSLALRKFLLRSFWQGIALVAVLVGVGSSAPPALLTRAWIIDTASGLANFDFVAWEIQSNWQKIGTALRRPDAELAADAESDLVRAYLERAQQIGQLEDELNQMLSSGSPIDHLYPLPGQPEGDGATLPTAASMREDLAGLRRQQAADRPDVEGVLQRQMTEELAAAGLGIRGVVFPPVHFTFTEPPLKLTVSPRDRIIAIHNRMLLAGNDPVAIAEGEQAIETRTNLSAYISPVGGIGTYPAMVVERAPLQWALSTIAHEWVHNYLTLFPLGLRYVATSELTILNETVAEIVGDEIGARLARRYYADALSPPAAADAPALADAELCEIYSASSPSCAMQPEPPVAPNRPPPFDFQREMRETRLHVDALLAAGLVETAEAYMEARRRYFVAQGYPLRVLNQAYFAFHGNYATGGAASSPIGPQLQRLREESIDLAHFLERVRWFTGQADLEKALGAT